MAALNDLGIFILTYGRAKEQTTLQLLKKYGITDNVYLIVADNDPQIEEYRKAYGRIVKEFNRNEVEEDIEDNVKPKSGVISARNYCFKLAKKLGYKYFVELDDDYSLFCFRYVSENKLKGKKVEDLKQVLVSTVQVLEDTPIECFAWAQTGDFVGGVNSDVVRNCFKRKAMNAMFFKTGTSIRFYGRINEDVNMYVHHGKLGQLVLTETFIALHQAKTQTLEHGMSDLYNENGTYLKSMYSVMQDPAIVSLSPMGNVHLRIHHRICWNACTPKVLSEEYKKK